MRLFRFDDPLHQEAAELLPWFVNGTLTRAEQALVERHVAECIACRQEINNLRALQTVIIRDDSDTAAAQGLARLQARIEQATRGASSGQLIRAIATQWHAMRLWLRAAVLAQMALIAILALVAIDRDEPQYYHTLSAPAARSSARGGLLLVFDPASSEQDIRNLLSRLHARIVDGPSPEGAYTVEVAAAEEDAALARLRKERAVKFAESAPLPRRP